MEAILAGLAVLTGFLFGLVLYVFQLRREFAQKGGPQPSENLVELVDQLFSNVLYAVALSLVTAVSLGVITAIGYCEDEGVDVIWSAIIGLSVTHLVFVIFMCIQRTRTAYRELAELN